MRHQTCTMLAIAGTLLLILAPVGPAAGQVVCGNIITEDTVLDADLDCSVIGAALALQVVGPATLDLNGHTVTCSDDGIGIFLVAAGARLVDGTVTLCEFAVDLAGDGGHTVRDVTLTLSSVGINVRSSGNRIQRNSLENNEDGIIVFAPDDIVDNRLIGNHIDGGVRGIVLGSVSTTVIANVVTGADGEGILVSDGEENKIRANQLSDNGIGIRVTDSAQSNVLIGNRATGNDDFDLVDQNSNCDDNEWLGNTFDTADPEDCID